MTDVKNIAISGSAAPKGSAPQPVSAVGMVERGKFSLPPGIAPTQTANAATAQASGRAQGNERDRGVQDAAKNVSLEERLKKAAKEIEKYLPKPKPETRLSIDIDKDSQLFVYKSIDSRTGEVISQYPAEEILKKIAYFREKEGLLVDSRA